MCSLKLSLYSLLLLAVQIAAVMKNDYFPVPFFKRNYFCHNFPFKLCCVDCFVVVCLLMFHEWIRFPASTEVFSVSPAVKQVPVPISIVPAYCYFCEFLGISWTDRFVSGTGTASDCLKQVNCATCRHLCKWGFRLISIWARKAWKEWCLNSIQISLPLLFS